MKTLALGLISASLLGYCSVAQAVSVTYNIKVTIDSSTTGELVGNTYLGQTSYDDTDLDRTKDSQDLPLTSFRFNFQGVDYGLEDDPDAVASFSQGNFLGVNYTGPDFAISPGILDINGSSFFYQPNNSTLKATGPVEYKPVPEPLTILGTGVVLGALPVLKKEYSKRKKDKDA